VFKKNFNTKHTQTQPTLQQTHFNKQMEKKKHIIKNQTKIPKSDRKQSVWEAIKRCKG